MIPEMDDWAADADIVCSRGKRPLSSWKLGHLIRMEGYHYGQSYCENERTEIYYDCYEIVKITPCGYWIDVWGKQKFVLKNARKRFAYETEELARESFTIRKRWQIRHLERQLESAKMQLSKVLEK